MRLWWRCWRWPPESPPRRRAAAAPGGKRKGFAGVGGGGCVKANVKFNQGFLFCLPDGLAFVDRPALWLPFDDVSDLRLARAEGAEARST